MACNNTGDPANTVEQSGGQRTPYRHTAGRGWNPAAEVYVKISRNANGVQVEDKKTDANNLSFSTQQSGPAGNEQVILTFNGHE